MSNIIFRSIGDKNNEQSNTIEESNSIEVEESVTQLLLVTQSGNVDALCKIFVSLLLAKGINCGIYFREFNPKCYCNSAISMINTHCFYNANFYIDSPSSNYNLWVDRIILYFTIL